MLSEKLFRERQAVGRVQREPTCKHGYIGACALCDGQRQAPGRGDNRPPVILRDLPKEAKP